MRIKNIRGITLIALVITIIILLILAGVTIATLTGENGILTKASTAKQETTKQEAKEKVQVEVMGSYDNNGKLNLEELNNNLKKNVEGLKYKGNPISNDNKIETLPAIVVAYGYNVKIHENGKVTIEGEDETGKDEPTPPIPPVSDVVVPGEIVTGNNKEYTKNGTATIPVGFAIVPGLDDVSEGLVISDVANDTENVGNQFVWIPVSDETPYERETSYIEAEVSTTACDDTGYLPDGITNEKQAVRNAKGFYIARYEAGKETIEGKDKIVSKKGAKVWVDISHESMKSVAKTMFKTNTNVKSALISGIQWDMAMKFISSKSRKDGENEPYDITESDIRRHIGGSSVAVSGNNEADRVCNIYDLEGNAYDYIAEKNTYYDDYSIVCRGGYYGYDFPTPASRRNHDNGGADVHYTFRPMLYVI